MLRFINTNNSKYFALLIIIITFLFRIPFLSIESDDYSDSLYPWVVFIQEHGYVNALKYNFANYTPPYLYFLVLVAKVGHPLIMIKFLSIIFDYFMAFFVAKIINLKYKNEIYFWLSFALVPLIPTVFCNSSWWGQCDSIYSSFVMGSIYFLMRKQNLYSVLFLSIAFCFKLQTIFIFPLFFILLLRGNIKWYYFLLIPIAYFIAVLPAWIVGRPLQDLLLIYLEQTNQYSALQNNFDNFYRPLEYAVGTSLINLYIDIIRRIGIIITFLCVFLLCLFLSKKKYKFTNDLLIDIEFLFLVLIPFLLPGMHERYLYLADVSSLMIFLYTKRPYQLVIIFVSSWGYMNFLLSLNSKCNDYMYCLLCFIAYIFVLFLSIYWLYKRLSLQSSNIVSIK